MFKRVLVTLDGSSFSEAALPEAAKLLFGTAAEVHLLIVAEEPRATAARPETEPLTIGVPAPGGVVQMGPAPAAETKAQAIGRVTDELRDFLIAEAVPFVMATHGHTGLPRLVFGSVASRVVGTGVCPVLLVRPDRLKQD